MDTAIVVQKHMDVLNMPLVVGLAMIVLVVIHVKVVRIHVQQAIVVIAVHLVQFVLVV